MKHLRLRIMSLFVAFLVTTFVIFCMFKTTLFTLYWFYYLLICDDKLWISLILVNILLLSPLLFLIFQSFALYFIVTTGTYMVVIFIDIIYFVTRFILALYKESNEDGIEEWHRLKIKNPISKYRHLKVNNQQPR